MKTEEREIIRTRGENGVIIYRDADLKEEITEEEIKNNIAIGNNTLDWRFAMTICKLKTFVGAMNEDFIDGVGLPLTSVIKDVENDLNEISNFIEKTLGDIVLLYRDEGRAYPGYTDEHVAGLAFRPAEEKEG